MVDAPIGDDGAIEQPGQRPHKNTEHDAQRGGTGDLDRRGGGDGCQPDDGADRNVHPTRDHDGGLGDGEHAQNGNPHAHIEDIAHGKEDITTQGAKQGKQGDERQNETEIVHPDAADGAFISRLPRMGATGVERFFGHVPYSPLRRPWMPKASRDAEFVLH